LNIYPQLPRQISLRLADDRRGLPIVELAALARPAHPASEYTPTGGAQATEGDMRLLRDDLLAIAQNQGYPRPPRQDDAAVFDAHASTLLFDRMRMAAVEATNPGVWEFVTCVLAPDLVRWRFFQDGQSTSAERFLAGRRNVFQRLWWRTYHLNHGAPRASVPHELLKQLGEDELVQLTERPRLAGISGLSAVVAAELLHAAARHQGVTRRELVRESQKRLLRVSTFLALESMSVQDLTTLVRSIYDDVARTCIESRLEQLG
jgi:hypothetical protein